MTTPITRPKTWRVELPPRQVLLNANERLHWSKEAPISKALRHTGWAMARYFKVPAMERAHAFFVYHPDTEQRNQRRQGKQRRDPANWAPSAKAVIDGFVDAGVLPDDNSERLLGPDPRLGPPVPGSQFVVYITDLDSLAPEHLAILNPPAGGLS